MVAVLFQFCYSLCHLFLPTYTLLCIYIYQMYRYSAALLKPNYRLYEKTANDVNENAAVSNTEVERAEVGEWVQVARIKFIKVGAAYRHNFSVAPSITLHHHLAYYLPVHLSWSNYYYHLKENVQQLNVLLLLLKLDPKANTSSTECDVIICALIGRGTHIRM